VRIGLDVTALRPTRTGVGQYVYYLLRHLLRSAPDCAFYGLSTGRSPAAVDGLPPLAGFRHVGVPTRLMYQWWNRVGVPKADRLLGGVDVFHATNYYLPPVATARRVVSFHDLAFLRHPGWSSPKITGVFARGVRRFAQEADAIIACSEATRRDIVELLDIPPGKVEVIYDAADRAFGAVSRPEAVDLLAQRHGLRQPYLLFVGTLEPRKNVEGLLEAFARVAKELPHQLVLVGQDGWGTAPIHALLRDPRLAGRVRRVGYVETHRELAAFYAAAEALVFPSHYEGFGLPVLEAMASGCPVITSHAASLPEVGGEAARYVRPDDLDGLASTIRLVAGHDDLRETMSQQGLAQARKFSWDRCAAETLALYRRLGPCGS
jgi:glycosyltransferase involved in cell wall biosynthesis